MNKDILFQIKISNPKSVEASLQLVKFAVPLSMGQLFKSNYLMLSDEHKKIVECEFVTVAYWPDASIKLIHVSALVTLPASSSQLFYIQEATTAAENEAQRGSTGPHNSIRYGDTPSSALVISSVKQKECTIAIRLTEQEQQPFSATQVNIHPKITEKRKIVEHTTAGFDFNTSTVPLPIQLFYKTEFISLTGQLQLTITLRNPNSASHPNGTWDLGDPTSFYFSELSVAISHHQAPCALKIEEHKILELNSDESIKVTQQGSGGENWQSPVHLDKNSQIDVDGPGYIVEKSVSSSAFQEVAELAGKRASPVFVLGDDEQLSAIYTEKFWQNFPSSISIENNVVTIGLFPLRKGKHYELQPGEQKTFTIVMQNFKNRSQALEADNGLVVVYPENAFADPNLLPLVKHDHQENALAALIHNGLQSENSFFVKREQLDEFGWRNFGELFADHEMEGYAGEEIFVSHYNNQYDPIYGFLRQYLNTGEPKWLELADDLAKHVIDIDIYHTEEDKADYNGGLFWHTDHYCPAMTATHRTHSTKQDQAVYDGHAGGGGPGGQHCYTTGLMLHYWLTGYEPSKQTVLRLTKWITTVYEGSGTLTETLISIKNKHRKDIKNVLSGDYPLDRGTGNYVVALLDSYQLTSQQFYLDCAGKILKSTISAVDVIEERDLSDVEETWFYTVLLQAAARYLLIKQAAGQMDNSFVLVQSALLHYASYMREHESPYLDTPEILEFPNQTWTGQDLRKANIFYAAAFFSTDVINKQKFQAQGERFYTYVTETLKNAPSLCQTRILALLMQNSGYRSWFKENNNTPQCINSNNIEQIEINHSVTKLLLKLTLSLNIKYELLWLRKRVTIIDKVLSTLKVK